MKVVLIRGLPGSGKSTMAKKYQCLHLESDFYFQRDGRYQWDEAREEAAHDWCYRKFSVALAEGQDVVVSNVFPTLKSLKRYIRTALAFGAEIKIETVTDNFGSIHNVREADLKRFEETFLNHPLLTRLLSFWLKDKKGATIEP